MPWFKPSVFEKDGERLAQADQLEGLDIVSVFLCLGIQSTVEHAKFVPSRFPNRYLVHGTNDTNLPSTCRLGLLPGGIRGGRQDVHYGGLSPTRVRLYHSRSSDMH